MLQKPLKRVKTQFYVQFVLSAMLMGYWKDGGPVDIVYLTHNNFYRLPLIFLTPPLRLVFLVGQPESALKEKELKAEAYKVKLTLTTGLSFILWILEKQVLR